MALKTCKECGCQVSSSANNCPYCGATLKYKIGCLQAGAIFFGVIVLMAVMNNEGKDDTSPRSSSSVPSSKAKQTRLPPYNVIKSEERMRGLKVTIEVVIQSKLSEKQLKDIGNELYKKHRDTNMFIDYHLGSKDAFRNGFATAKKLGNTDPISVRMLGTLDKKVAKAKIIHGEKIVNLEGIIGTWVNEKRAGGFITLYKSGNKIFVVESFFDGSGISKEMILKKSQSGERQIWYDSGALLRQVKDELHVFAGGNGEPLILWQVYKPVE